jgi:hypothetical protein
MMLLVLLLLPAVLQDPRKPVPDEKSQKEAEAMVRDVYKEDFARTGQSDRKLLVAKLVKQAAETRDDPTAVYAMLVHARTIAAQVADVKGGSQAVDDLVKNYAVDPIAVRKAFLVDVSKTVKTTEELTGLAEVYLWFADEAAAAEAFGEAQAAAGAASVLAKRAKAVLMVTRADARQRELEAQRVATDGLRKAREALAKSPEDPAANFIVGKQECVAGNWAKGLPLLVKGSDAAWKDAAVRDAAEPAAAMDQMTAGDGWWELAEKEKGGARTALQKRAVHWYARAEGQLGGLNVAKVRKRMAEVKGVPVAIDVPSSLLAAWSFDEGSGPDLRATGGVSWVAGKSGRAAKLDGAGGYLSVPESGRFNFGKNSFTVCCWINLAATTKFRLINKWDQPSNRGWLLDVNEANRKPDAAIIDEPGSLRLRISDGKTNLQYSTGGGLGTGGWKHVAMSVDQSGREVKLYVDGAQVGATLTIKEPIDVDTTQPLAIGNLPSASGLFFNGMIDEVKIFGEALSAKAIKALAEKP